MIIDQLQEKFPDMPNLRVRDIYVDKIARKVSCTVSYPAATELEPSVVSAIKTAVYDCIPTGYRCETRMVNDKFNEKSFVAVILDVIKKKYPLFGNVKGDKISVQIVGKDISATFCVSENTKRNMEVAEFLLHLEEFFHTYTSYNVTLGVTVDVNATVSKAAIAEQEKMVQLAINKELLKPQRHFAVSNVTKYIGKEIFTQPMYISDIRAPMENCVVCGVLSEKQLRALPNKPNLQLCKFNLTDGSAATIPCTMFVRLEIVDFNTLKSTNTEKSDAEILTLSKKHQITNDNRLKKVQFLSNGLEVLVRGKVVYSDFSKSLELQVYDICKCKIEPLSSQQQYERPAPKSYVLVEPKQIEEYRQLSFEQLQEPNTPLTGKDYVVLCVNTTGYNVAKDKIFNLCAVRVSNGHLKEKFSTLVSPETLLTDAQYAEANATLRQISVSPTITEIISDLFKFVGNSVLVGSNLAQLVELLNYYAAPLGYNFRNQTETQNTLLSSLFDSSSYDSKPNCTVIEDVVKFLKINCKVSTSAEDVALAVAKCMVTLCER